MKSSCHSLDANRDLSDLVSTISTSVQFPTPSGSCKARGYSRFKIGELVSNASAHTLSNDVPFSTALSISHSQWMTGPIQHDILSSDLILSNLNRSVPFFAK